MTKSKTFTGTATITHENCPAWLDGSAHMTAAGWEWTGPSDFEGFVDVEVECDGCGEVLDTEVEVGI